MNIVQFISGGGSTAEAVNQVQQPGGVLHELTTTLAVIASNPDAGGLKLAEKHGIPTHVVCPGNRFAERLVAQLDAYRPNYFHQLGWMPHTPREVLDHYRGLNQHFGPGGQYMYGVRRAYVHITFCKRVGRNEPIGVVCQRVHPELDKGNAILVEYVDVEPQETPEELSDRLLAIEWRVQIEALRRLANNTFQEVPVPCIAKTPDEVALLDQLRVEAHEKYDKQA